MHIAHTFKHNPVRNGFIAIITSLTLLLAGQIIYTSTMDAGAAPGFNSETDPNVLPMLDGFKSLPSSTMQENDDKTENINNNATSAEIADAFTTICRLASDTVDRNSRLRDLSTPSPSLNILARYSSRSRSI